MEICIFPSALLKQIQRLIAKSCRAERCSEADTLKPCRTQVKCVVPEIEESLNKQRKSDVPYNKTMLKG